MAKRYDPYKSTNSVYMTQEAYNILRTQCSANLFRRLTIYNLQYDHKQPYIKKSGYCFMIEFAESDTNRIHDVIKSSPMLISGTVEPDYIEHLKTTYYKKPINKTR